MRIQILIAFHIKIIGDNIMDLYMVQIHQLLNLINTYILEIKIFTI